MPNYITDDSVLSQLNGATAQAPAASAAPAQAAPAQSPLDRALQAEGVDGPLAGIARSVYRQESASGANPKTSNAGAVGGMQVLPTTFKEVADPGWDIANPDHNARAGVRYLKAMYDASGGNPTLTAVGYYGGPGGMEKAAQGIPVADPRNPKAPNTLQYAEQVTSRLPAQTTAAAAPATAAAAPAAPGKQYVQDPALLESLNARTASSSGTVADFLSAAGHNVMKPLHGAAQLVENTAAAGAKLLPDNPVSRAVVDTAARDNAALQQSEKEYQQSTPDNAASYAGATVGTIAPLALTGAGKGLQAIGDAVASKVAGNSPTIAKIASGATQGGVMSAANPVTNGGDNYWRDKGVGTIEGAAGGGIMTPVAGAIARLVSPNASTNGQLQLLKDAGVQPTIGQSLGGAWNAVEEKLQSVPIMGDMIGRARGQARDQFNTAAINRATSPIGETVKGAGQGAVKEAGDKLSAAYDAALNKVQGVQLDPQFHADLGQLRGMAQGMAPSMAQRFEQVLNDKVLGRASPHGVLTGQTYKTIDSDLGTMASRYGKSSVASEGELGDAVGQLRNLLRQQMARTNPQAAQELAAADEGWANLVRVENAAKAATNAEGVFTPGQLNQSIRSADDSVRKRAVSRGEALMQDLGNAGQQVLGNKVPDSGTVGRGLASIGALATAAIHPAIPIGLGIGGAAYTGPLQSALRAAVSSRPQIAKPVAKTIRDVAPLLGGAAGGALALQSGGQ
jgi:hypothetical protein